MSQALLFLIGASGAGKTAVTKALEGCGIPWLRCYYFDSIGVPSTEIMDRDFGGGENWQSVATARWVDRLAQDHDNSIAVLEGQTRPSFILAALDRAHVRHASIVLLDCDPDVRAARLHGLRNQPELATPQMDGWAIYLRGQADALGLPVVDTSRQPIETVVNELRNQLNALYAKIHS
jgi:shikimate kinase